MPTRIAVENLPIDAAEQTLRTLLSRYVEIRSIRIVRQGSELAGSSHCVVEVPEDSRPERAVRALNGQYYRGRLLSVATLQSSARPTGTDPRL